MPGFDVTRHPPLNPRDFQWGAPTSLQQQQQQLSLYQHYMQPNYMFAHPSTPAFAMHPSFGPVMVFPVMMGPGLFPAMHPGEYKAYPIVFKLYKSGKDSHMKH